MNERVDELIELVKDGEDQDGSRPLLSSDDEEEEEDVDVSIEQELKERQMKAKEVNSGSPQEKEEGGEKDMMGAQESSKQIGGEYHESVINDVYNSMSDSDEEDQEDEEAK